MLIERLKKEYMLGEPIFVKDILSLFPEYTRAYVFQLIKKEESQNRLVKFSRGVYFIPKKTVIGNSSLTSNEVAYKKYVNDGKNYFGLYSGLSLLNYFAVSTLIPNVIEIITNNEATRKRRINICGMEYIVRKSKFEINNDNYKYYLILQLFLELGVNPKLNSLSKKMIKDYICNNQLNVNELINYSLCFPPLALKNLMGSGVIHGSI